VVIRDSFFFQAEDGIRVFHVTGVQTCALPISRRAERRPDAGWDPVRPATGEERDEGQAPRPKRAGSTPAASSSSVVNRRGATSGRLLSPSAQASSPIRARVTHPSVQGPPHALVNEAALMSRA